MSDYLDKAGLTESLNKLGFQTVGYGCTTCIGNSGPLPEPVAKAVEEGNLVAAAVLSGLMKGAAETRNRPAVAEVPSGKGRVVMFATNPCFRYQNLGEFNMLFNAVLHFNDVSR